MKVNELVCPTCGLKMYTKCSYATCDGCQTYFHASQSRKSVPPYSHPVSVPYLFPGHVVWEDPYKIYRDRVWVTVGDPPVTYVTGSVTVSTTAHG